MDIKLKSNEKKDCSLKNPDKTFITAWLFKKWEDVLFKNSIPLVYVQCIILWKCSHYIFNLYLVPAICGKFGKTVLVWLIIQKYYKY